MSAGEEPQPNNRPAITAALLLNPALGSLYAWSVFLAPLELAIGATRAEISVVFSVAMIAFTVGTAAAPITYALASPWKLVLGAAAMAAAGLYVASTADTLYLVIVGYGLMFELGAGFSYSVMLQIINLAMPRRRGLANGLGITAFAAGSILLAVVFDFTIPEIGPRGTFAAMGAAFIAVGGAAAMLTRLSGVSLPRWSSGRRMTQNPTLRIVIWLCFFLGATSGVMAIGHAATVVVSFGGTAALGLMGAVFVNIGNAGGRLGGGWLCDFWPLRRVATLAHLLAMCAFLAALAAPSPATAIVAVAGAGLSYGLISSTYVTALSIFFGVENFGRNFAMLMTAWAMAGLSGPWLAGELFDRSGDYFGALAVAAVFSLIALIVCTRIPTAVGETKA